MAVFPDMIEPADRTPRAGRLLSILLLLQSRREVSARELSEHLGVSMRTVYRDVDALVRVGVPVYAETGRAGGYRLVEGYRTTLTGLTSDESLALFLIGLPAPAASLGLSRETSSAETKVLAALSPGHRAEANRLRERFLLDLPAWYSELESPPMLRSLTESLLANRRVRVRYWRWAEPREVQRVLEPHGLVVKNGAWYVVAADRTRRLRSPMRVYRVSNILDLNVTDEVFLRADPFDLATFWQEHLGDFDRRRFTQTAAVRVAPRLVERLPDIGDRGLRQAVATGSLDELGWTVVHLPIESVAKGAAALIPYGDDVEVQAPPELRRALLDLALAVAGLYAET